MTTIVYKFMYSKTENAKHELLLAECEPLGALKEPFPHIALCQGLRVTKFLTFPSMTPSSHTTAHPFIKKYNLPPYTFFLHEDCFTEDGFHAFTTLDASDIDNYFKYFTSVVSLLNKVNKNLD